MDGTVTRELTDLKLEKNEPQYNKHTDLVPARDRVSSDR